MNVKNANKRKMISDSIKLFLEVSKMDFLIMLFVSIINSLYPIIGIYLSKLIFDDIGQMYVDQSIDSLFYAKLAFYMIYMLISLLYSQYYKRYFVQFKSITNFEKKMKIYLHEKCNKISNEEFENSLIYNYIGLAQNATINIYRLVEIVVTILCAIITTIVVSLYISTMHWLFFIFMFFSIIPSLLEIMHSTKQWSIFEEENVKLKREEAEYIKAITSIEALKETRISGTVNFFKNKWIKSFDKRAQNQNTVNNRLFKFRLLLSALKIIGDTAGLFVSVILLLNNKIDIGIFAAGISAYGTLKSNYENLFSMFGYLTQFSSMVSPFFRFYSLKDRQQDSDGNSYSFNKDIKLEHVSFKYPTSKTKALNDICLTINKGETIAIVGENGAGKSTLLNIVLGLYLPSEGEVLYDGKKIRNISEKILYRDKSAVMQDYCKYNMTLRDNITISDPNNCCPEDKIERELQKMFPNKSYNSSMMLGKLFGGKELSGGEWQKISILRGINKDAEIFVFDEPTSSVDPLSEADLYNNIEDHVIDSTSIIITHRLGSIKLADRILVINQGELVEVGTHEQLLKNDAQYFKLWNSQSNLY